MHARRVDSAHAAVTILAAEPISQLGEGSGNAQANGLVLKIPGRHVEHTFRLSRKSTFSTGLKAHWRDAVDGVVEAFAVSFV